MADTPEPFLLVQDEKVRCDPILKHDVKKGNCTN